jgi:Asp-tRNA(Asn)/Glu-tRNA(Gln) amidotransferase A subunit family amidase
MDASQEQTDVKAWVVLNPSGAREAADASASPTSILGAPAVTVPMLAIEGMPVGIQIVGQCHADARTARIARWLLETMKPASVD